MWGLRRQRLIHDYSLVGYILAPNPNIMCHAIRNKKFAHEQAAERLIVKLLLSPSLNGNAREIEKARLIDKFHQEFGESNLTNHIFGLQQLILVNRPTVGIKSILSIVLKYWASLHVLLPLKYWELGLQRGTGSRSRL